MYYGGDLLQAAAAAALLLAMPFAIQPVGTDFHPIVRSTSWLRRSHRRGGGSGAGPGLYRLAGDRAVRATRDWRAMTMTNAVVLIEAERDALSTLGGALADIEGVAEVYR